MCRFFSSTALLLVALGAIFSSCGKGVNCTDLKGRAGVWAPYEQGDELPFLGEDGTKVRFQVSEVAWSASYEDRCYVTCGCDGSVYTLLDATDTNLTSLIRHEEHFNLENDCEVFTRDIHLSLGSFSTTYRPIGTDFPVGPAVLHTELEINSVVYRQVHEFHADTNTSDEDIWRIYVNQENGFLQFSSRSSGEWVYDPN